PFVDASGEVVRVDALQFRCSSSTLRTRGTLANARSRATWPTSPRDRRTIARVRRRRVLGRDRQVRFLSDVAAAPARKLLARKVVTPKFRQLEPRGQLVAATGGHSSSRLTADDGPTDIP